MFKSRCYHIIVRDKQEEIQNLFSHCSVNLQRTRKKKYKTHNLTAPRLGHTNLTVVVGFPGQPIGTSVARYSRTIVPFLYSSFLTASPKPALVPLITRQEAEFSGQFKLSSVCVPVNRGGMSGLAQNYVRLAQMGHLCQSFIYRP